PAPPPQPPSEPAIIVAKVPVEPIKIEIPSGSGLDAIDFSSLIPGTQRGVRDDGTLSGVNVLALDDLDDVDDLSLDDAEILPDTHRVPGPAARRALLTTPLFSQVQPRAL